MIGGAGVLMMLPLAGEVRPVVAHARVPDPPALPCKQQTWPNADRGCLKWTAPRAVAQSESGAQKSRTDARAVAAAGAGMAAPAPQVITHHDDHAREQVAARIEPAPQLRMQIAPDDRTQRVAPSQPQPAVTPQPHVPPSPAVDVAFASGAGEPQGLAPHTAPVRTAPREGVRTAQAVAPAHSGIAVTATGADGRRRTITIRPTSQQDVYYYAARR
jgi:hypothetical protein